jgi:hypothetical protein
MCLKSKNHLNALATALPTSDVFHFFNQTNWEIFEKL